MIMWQYSDLCYSAFTGHDTSPCHSKQTHGPTAGEVWKDVECHIVNHNCSLKCPGSPWPSTYKSCALLQSYHGGIQWEASDGVHCAIWDAKPGPLANEICLIKAFSQMWNGNLIYNG